MRGLKYKIQSGNCSIEITEIENDIEFHDKEGLKIYDVEVSKVNTKLEILVEDYLLIYYYFENYPTGLPDITIYVIPETQTLLIGGKNKSCSINMLKNKVENEFAHCLFWDFSLLHNGYILETGELDCLLRDSSGNILDTVQVDPPWECFHEKDGIRFKSIVYGETFLKYPK